MNHHRVATLLDHPLESGRPVDVSGWVRTRRDSKSGFSFLEINDGSCLRNLQVIADQKLDNYKQEILHLHPGAAIRVQGPLVASTGKEQPVEIHATAIQVLGTSDPAAYPLGKQRVTFERLREIPHLRPRTNTLGAIARIRHVLAMAVHRFFDEKGFLYVQTPILTTSDCEGAGEMFQVTTLDIENPPRLPDRHVDYAHDFFGKRTHLTVSGQLAGEAYACALRNIYTFGPTFRAENSNTRRHLAEFWMVEPEMAFADLADDCALAADFLRTLFKTVLEKSGEDLAFFDQRIARGLCSRLESLAQAQYQIVAYSEAIEHLCQAETDFEFKPEWGVDLQSEHERYLTETVYKGPVILVDYPRTIKAFYMRRNPDERTVAAMDVLLPEVGEIIGGSQREERLPVLIEAMRTAGLEPDDYVEYLDLRRFGGVPHAGFGLGFERLVQVCTGMHNIRDVIPYPRTPNNCLG